MKIQMKNLLKFIVFAVAVGSCMTAMHFSNNESALTYGALLGGFIGGWFIAVIEEAAKEAAS